MNVSEQLTLSNSVTEEELNGNRSQIFMDRSSNVEVLISIKFCINNGVNYKAEGLFVRTKASIKKCMW